MSKDKPDLVDAAARIVAAYVSRNQTAPDGLGDALRSVHRSLRHLQYPPALAPVVAKPPVPIRKSIHADHLISLEDGKPYKALKRHLSVRGLTPDACRKKWGLPYDYPMVAPNYALERSRLATLAGLGRTAKKPQSTPKTRKANASRAADQPSPRKRAVRSKS